MKRGSVLFGSWTGQRHLGQIIEQKIADKGVRRSLVDEYVYDSTRVELMNIPSRKTKQHRLVLRPDLIRRNDSHAPIVSRQTVDASQDVVVP